jgi:hypothetical protein
VLRQVRVTFALRDDSFKIVLADESEQTLAVLVYVIAIKKAFAMLRHHSMKPELPVNERQVPKVFAIAESPLLLFVIRQCVLIPE